MVLLGESRKALVNTQLALNRLFEVFGSGAGGGGEAKSLVGFDAEAEEFFVWQSFAEVGFVEQEEDWFFRTEGVFGDLFVAIVGIFGAIKRKQDEIGRIDCIGNLVLDASLKIVIGVFQTGGINQQKALVNACHDVVASGSLFASDDSDVFARKTVQKTRFTGVGLADECDDWKLFHSTIIAFWEIFDRIFQYFVIILGKMEVLG